MESQEPVSLKPAVPTFVNEMLDDRLVAALGTLDSDGKIHLVPMWFRREGETILLPTSSRSRKARNVQRHPHASLMIHQARSAIEVRGVLIRGAVQIVRGEEAKELNRSIHLRYISARGLTRDVVVRSLTVNDDATLVIAIEDLTTWDLTELEMTRVLAEHGDAYALS